jgi:hypothetical protein
MESIKDGATKRINHCRQASGTLFQARFFDRALRTVREYHEKVAYIHRNPVAAGRVDRAEDGPWSSDHDYTGNLDDRPAGSHGQCFPDRGLFFRSQTSVQLWPQGLRSLWVLEGVGT